MSAQEVFLEASSNETPVRIKLSPSNTAVLILSMQNEFCSTGGEASVISGDRDMSESTRKPIKAIQEITIVARKSRCKIIHCTTGYRPDLADAPENYIEKHAPRGEGAAIGSSGPQDSKSHVSGKWGSEIIEELKPVENDLVINGSRFNKFIYSELEAVLRNFKINTLVFTGIEPDITPTLLYAADIGYRCILILEACGTIPLFQKAFESYSLKVIEHAFGWLTTPEKFVQALG
jgi:nicotinamidase-related amidase